MMDKYLLLCNRYATQLYCEDDSAKGVLRQLRDISLTRILLDVDRHPWDTPIAFWCCRPSSLDNIKMLYWIYCLGRRSSKGSPGFILTYCIFIYIFILYSSVYQNRRWKLKEITCEFSIGSLRELWIDLARGILSLYFW